MNRLQWQELAEMRLADARALLKAHRWSAAYYLAGYAVECGLKACILARMSTAAEVIFDDKKFSEKCWTHALIDLVKLAGLEAARVARHEGEYEPACPLADCQRLDGNRPLPDHLASEGQEVVPCDNRQTKWSNAMDQGPLVTEQIDAGARFVREFAKYKPVHAAFWLLGTDENPWFLYVVSDQINDSNFRLAYGEVIRIARTTPDPWLDPFQVKVMGTHKPLAKAVLQLQVKYAGNLPTRYHGPPLGNLSIDEVYIYPPQTAVHA